jgi:multicomponent Na+:H+ antiporter subunit B
MKLFGLIAVLVTGGLLLAAVADFPDWGDPHSPANAGTVSHYYIENTMRDTGVPNLVTAVLADYRGYDTMFETVVVLIAGLAVMAILKVAPKRGAPPSPPHHARDQPDIIIAITCRILTPLLQLFALYVIAHGHHSPGGGFQGGVILGASFILLAISQNLNTALKRLPEKRYVKLALAGVAIYAGFGIACQFLGENFLDYSILHKWMPATDAVMARSHSMLGVEVGVAFTVSAIMFAIYANLSSRGKLKGGM